MDLAHVIDSCLKFPPFGWFAQTRVGRRVLPKNLAEFARETMPGTLSGAVRIRLRMNRLSKFRPGMDLVEWSARPSTITTRFVVLSQGRSGSTLLVDELNRRWPEIRSMRESFNPRSQEPFEAIVFDTWLSDTGQSIVGCKVFDGHLDAERLSTVLSLQGMHVIVLKRRNQVRRLVSESIAKNTNVWRQRVNVDDAGSPGSDQKRIRLDLVQLFERMQISVRWFGECEGLVGSLPRLDVWYEDLAADIDGELRRVASFLGAGEPVHEGAPLLVKQNPEPLEELVVNFDEVCEFLVDVGLGEYLEMGDGFEGRGGVGASVGSVSGCWPTALQCSVLGELFGVGGLGDGRVRSELSRTAVIAGAEGMAPLYPALHHRFRDGDFGGSMLVRMEATTNTARGLRLFGVLPDLVAAFSESGCDVVLLGSSALGAMVWGRDRGAFRCLVVSGLDLFVFEQERARAFAVVERSGWVGSVIGERVGLKVFRKDGLELRFHSRVVADVDVVGLDAEFVDGAGRVDVSGVSVKVLAPSDLFFALVAGGVGSGSNRSIGWLVDVGVLLGDSGDLIEWGRVGALAERCGLGDVMGEAVVVLDEVFGALLPRGAVEMVRASGVSGTQEPSRNETTRP